MLAERAAGAALLTSACSSALTAAVAASRGDLGFGLMLGLGGYYCVKRAVVVQP